MNTKLTFVWKSISIIMLCILVNVYATAEGKRSVGDKTYQFGQSRYQFFWNVKSAPSFKDKPRALPCKILHEWRDSNDNDRRYFLFLDDTHEVCIWRVEKKREYKRVSYRGEKEMITTPQKPNIQYLRVTAIGTVPNVFMLRRIFTESQESYPTDPKFVAKMTGLAFDRDLLAKLRSCLNPATHGGNCHKDRYFHKDLGKFFEMPKLPEIKASETEKTIKADETAVQCEFGLYARKDCSRCQGSGTINNKYCSTCKGWGGLSDRCSNSLVNKLGFSFGRRHHCRKCKRAICTACSRFGAFNVSNKADWEVYKTERVNLRMCKGCYGSCLRRGVWYARTVTFKEPELPKLTKEQKALNDQHNE